jgi:hypothetical protein
VALISFLPTALINYRHGSGWTGLASDVLPPPGVNFICTIYRILAHNLVPPMLAFTDTGEKMQMGLANSFLGQLLDRYYHEPKPLFYYQIAIEQVGIGFVVSLTLLLLILVTKGRKVNWKWHAVRFLSVKQSLIFAGLGIAFLHYLFFVNSDQPARLICTYYLLLTPIFFSGRILRDWFPFRLAKTTTATAMCTGIFLAFFFAENPPICLKDGLYSRERGDEQMQKLVRHFIPSSEKNIGISRYWNERETWLWKPYGARKVVEFPVLDPSAASKDTSINYMIVSQRALLKSNQVIDSWLVGQPWKLDFSISDEPPHGWYNSVDGWYFLERKPAATN